MLSSHQNFPIGYSILTVLGLLPIHTLCFAPQSENLSSRDFKTLLAADTVEVVKPRATPSSHGGHMQAGDAWE